MYLYVLGHSEDELELAQAEAQNLAPGKMVHQRILLSASKIDPASTGYITMAAELICSAPSLEELATLLQRNIVTSQNFRIDVKKIPSALRMQSRDIAGRIAYEIRGNPNLDNPSEVFLAVATETAVWLGRRLSVGQSEWRTFHDKLFDFSSALPSRMARAVVNLAAVPGQTLADPCCGSGTIILNAAQRGMKVTGWDINQRMVWMSQKNMRHFGLCGDVELGDASQVTGSFDAVATNLPYGNFCRITPEQYRDILANCRHLAPRLVLVAATPSRDILEDVGYEIEKVIHTGRTVAHRIIYCCRLPTSLIK